MNPVYQISPPLPSPFPIADQPNDEDHHYLQLFSPSSKASASSESSSSFLSNSIFSNLAQEHGSTYDRDLQQGEHQEEAMKCVFKIGSSAHHEILESPSLPTVEHDLINGQQTSVYEGNDGDQYQSNSGSVKWMSSKMRLMKKMSNSDRTGVDIKVENKNKFQDHQNPPTSPLDTENSSNSSSNNNSTTTVRVCSDCYTTKTPLWRSGPRGPKSLCNACGIRQRKARRAMATAAAVASGGLLGNEISSMKTKVNKDKRSDNNGYAQQYKKRCKLTGPCSRNKICFEDFSINLSKNSAFHQVFPQDEKEAAILLMALSCGLVLL